MLTLQIHPRGFDIFLGEERKHCVHMRHRTSMDRCNTRTLLLHCPSTDDYCGREQWKVQTVWWGYQQCLQENHATSQQVTQSPVFARKMENGSGQEEDLDAPVPHGWARIFSQSQQRYYYSHAATRHSQWHLPTASEVADPVKAKKRADTKTELERASSKQTVVKVRSHCEMEHPRRLFIRGLGKVSTQPDIELRRAQLERVFAKYGHHLHGASVIAPKNKGFAFVEVKNKEMADLALKELAGRFLICRATLSRQEAKLLQQK